MTCTVVSVIPYMLTKVGASSGWRSYQGASRPTSSASPPKMTRRRLRSAPPSAASAASAATSAPKADGVWLRTVTDSRRSRARNCSGERETSWSTTTSRPPCSSGPHSSHTEKSNDAEWNSVHTSAESKWKWSRLSANRRTTLRCGISVPLGRPVEPEV